MSLPLITVWSAQDSPRLRYVLDWLLGERLGFQYLLTQDKAEALATAHSLSYGWLGAEIPGIHAATSLLWEEGIQQQQPVVEEWQGLHTLYFNPDSPCDIQFDMLAGIFFLLSRYEEYMPFTPDKHNRFPAGQSVLFSILERPVVDEWAEALRLFLEQVWNISIPRSTFSFQPSYDIDIAWSFKYKGWRRTIGASVQDIVKGNFARVKQRMHVLRSAKEDPYNSFVFLFALHMMDKARPLYFILSALRPSPFDKNISPLHPQMASLIKAIGNGSVVGLHPSYYSDALPELLIQEKATLERLIQLPVKISRQHYIKLRFPHTYHALIEAGIEADYSMGYSTHFGFRAGTSHSFLWYDLKEEYGTSLRVHPFAFMDSTAHYDLGLSAEAAFSRLRQIAAHLAPCGGKLITIMHNYSLGTDPEWKGWRKEYEQCLIELKTKGNTAFD